MQVPPHPCCADTRSCLNPFGETFGALGTWADIAPLDSDGDGFTNGEELGDPEGIWTVAEGTLGACGCATRPGGSDFTPGDNDSDGDGICCLGRDLDMNGDCLGATERVRTHFDCDDMMSSVNSAAAEVCTNFIDNDCDGLTTLADPDCLNVVDRDGDGFCVMGRDIDGDGNCLGTGEMTSDVDCNDDPTTFGASMTPGARENCADGRDNNCDSLVDEADPTCRSDVDNDMDGFCPIGTDLSEPPDGDCLDPGEVDAGFDCDDFNPMVNPLAVEICTDGADNDCDGFEDFLDASCTGFSDLDGDGYCPRGRDMDGDGSCIDPGEDVGPFDCQDDPTMNGAAINPGASEVCTENRYDEDCDTLVSLDDPDCADYVDADGDRYCVVGRDFDRDGFCVSPGEAGGRGDCDDTRPEINPAQIEICTDGLDNDCNRDIDAADRPTCAAYWDTDEDGWCLIGRDRNGDRDCADVDEPGEPTERQPRTLSPTDLGSEGDPTTYPGAPENCFDRRDNDLDGDVDEAAACVRDRDADGDGYCPIGQDVNGDGDCLDDGENRAVSDCNDADMSIHPGAAERCRENIDADCDGDVRTLDTDCYYLLDRDGDGVCGMGTDDTMDGDCEDANEDRFGRDCDDSRRDVNDRLLENCSDGIDNDCDRLIDVFDPQCTCSDDALCADDDPCTIDACGPNGRGCTNTPDPSCAPGAGDAGMCEGPDCVDAGCGCGIIGASRAPTAGRSAIAGSTWGWTISGWVMFFSGLRRRRRRRRTCA